MNEVNPISQVYSELVKISMENTVLQKYLQEGNFRILDGSYIPKQSLGTADLPELALLITNVQGAPIASSSRGELTVTYNWLLTTGSMDLQDKVSEILWGLFTASCSWCLQLPQLEYEGLQFVKNVILESSDFSLTDTEVNKGILGWSNNWPLLVEMQFKSSDLRKFQWQDH